MYSTTEHAQACQKIELPNQNKPLQNFSESRKDVLQVNVKGHDHIYEFLNCGFYER